MRPYVANFIPDDDIRIFDEIRHCIVSIDDIQFSRQVVLSCHILSIAVAEVFEMTCCHGVFYHGYDHSWLLTKSGHIIDVYPVATVTQARPLAISPILQDAVSGPARQLYKQLVEPEEIEKRYGQIFDKPEFRLAVSMISRHLRQHRNALYMQRLNGHKEPREDSEPREE